jgi:CelD/BcsL family acetyltransferase involved in cellulose biosynthesis
LRMGVNPALTSSFGGIRGRQCDAPGVRRSALSGRRQTHGLGIELHASIEPIAQDWEALAERIGAVPWARPGWFAAWYDSFAAGRTEVVVARRAGRVIGVAPLMASRGVLRSASNWHTPEFPLIAEAGAEMELAKAVLARRMHRVALQFVASEDPWTKAFRAASEEAAYKIQTRTLERCPYIDTGVGWDEYSRARSTKLLRDLRRRRRLLDSEGSFEFRVHDGRDGLEALLEEGFRVEAAGWKSDAHSAIASQGETRRFYERIAAWAADQGWLRLGFLRLDEKAFAFDFSIEYAGVHYLLKTGYDPAYSRFAPGKILRREMIARAFDEGLRSYEFLGADEAWKLEWTSSVRQLDLMQAYAPSTRGRLERAAFELGRPLAKRALALGRR